MHALLQEILDEVRPLLGQGRVASYIPALADVAPITQRSASSRLDFPQPFGPTMPVSPGSIRNSVGSTKDLKPASLRRWKCTAG